MSYTNVFGGENINPADLSYKLYDFRTTELLSIANFFLVWPFEALDGRAVVADKMDIVATTTSGNSITLPDATLVSVGEDVLWNNIGDTTFTVRSLAGVAICTVAPGTQWYTYLTDNSTPGGIWRALQFGAAASASNAAALAGAGLRSTETARLDQNLLVDGVSGNLTLDYTRRAQVIRNGGGVATWTIALASTLGPPPNPFNGWFVVAINSGGGNVTLQPSGGQLIDSASSKVLSPGESCVVYCTAGSDFVTMGYGRSVTGSVTGISIDVAGTGDFTLNAAQVAAQVQNYTGTVTAPRTIIYGPGTGYWFIYNNTNAPLQFKGATSDTIVTVGASAFSILRSQSGALDIAFTSTSGTVTSITGITDQIVTVPNPLIAAGTIDLSVIAGLAPGTYGAGGTPTQVPVVTVDDRGRVRAAQTVPISISQSQIYDMSTLLEFLVPAGTMMPFAGPNLPPIVPPTSLRAWLLCDGSSALKSDYPRLWNALGNTYGTSDAISFRLPDLRGRTIAGVDVGGPNGPSGRLTANAAGFAQNPTLAAASGQEYEQTTVPIPTLSVSVGQWAAGGTFGASGYTTGTQSINITSDGASTIGSVGSGGSPQANVTPDHTHGIHGNTGGENLGVAINSFGATGNTNNPVTTSSFVTNVQPTLLMNWLIKT